MFMSMNMGILQIKQTSDKNQGLSVCDRTGKSGKEKPYEITQIYKRNKE